MITNLRQEKVKYSQFKKEGISMKQNVGGLDRGLRLVIGAALLAAGYVKATWWLALIGAIVFLTGIIGWCGFYTLLGINTAKKAKAKKTSGKKSKAKKKK